MKTLFIALLVSLLSLPGYSQKQFVVDADAEMRDIRTPFSSIKVSGGISLYLSQADEVAVAVSAPDASLRDAIRTKVENGQLNIYFENDGKWRLRNKKLVVYVSFNDLKRLDASGASDIIVAGNLNLPSLELHMSGASDFKGAVTLTSLQLFLSGASDVYLTGTATNLNIESSGASDVKAYELITEICSARASGASDVHITVQKELNVQASGASKVLYKGDAVIKDIQNSGASTVSKRG